MVGISLFGPPSITSIDSLGSASASLAATTHPAVPPGQDRRSSVKVFRRSPGIEVKHRTSRNDNINFVNFLRQIRIQLQTHGATNGAGVRLNVTQMQRTLDVDVESIEPLLLEEKYLKAETACGHFSPVSFFGTKSTHSRDIYRMELEQAPYTSYRTIADPSFHGMGIPAKILL